MELSELIAVEHKTCKQLIKILPTLPSNEFNAFQSSARDKLLLFTSNPKGNALDISVRIPVFDARDKKSPLMIYIAAQLDQRKKTATYKVAIARIESQHGRKILETKSFLHWDHEFSTSETEKKPRKHMQIGGRIPDTLKEFGFEYCWDKRFDKPRIPTMPMSFVLVLHWCFLEYAHCSYLQKVIDLPAWRNIVKIAEAEVLYPYYNEIHKLISVSGKLDNRTLMEALYA